MKYNDNTSRILTLMGLSLLAMASEGNPGQYDDAVRLAMMRATGIEAGSGTDGANRNSSSPGPTDYCHGIRGLADHLSISIPSAQKLVNSGIMDPAIRRVGHKYSFLKSKVDEILSGTDK